MVPRFLFDGRIGEHRCRVPGEGNDLLWNEIADTRRPIPRPVRRRQTDPHSVNIGSVGQRPKRDVLDRNPDRAIRRQSTLARRALLEEHPFGGVHTCANLQSSADEVLVVHVAVYDPVRSGNGWRRC